MTIGEISSFVSILTAMVGVVFWFLRKDFNKKKDDLDSKVEKFRSENKYLRGQLKEYENFGVDIISSKRNIDAELQNISMTIGADSGTVYIPFSQIDNPEGLKIVSITPINEHTSKLYNQLIPLTSIAGSVFKSKKPQLTHNANNSNHYKTADMISGYKTMGMLTIPVKRNDKVIAVLQLFNSKEKVFSDDVLPTAQSMVSNTHGLSEKVDKFIKLPRWQDLFKTKDVYQSEIIMFCDLTSSSILFNELNIESTFDHLNNFFEEVSNVALAHGALIDKYMGDGILLRFIDTEISKAFESALLIRKNFETLKTRWQEESDLFSSIFIRIGIANGPVVEHIVGHHQYQAISIFGQAVNVAINLCGVAPRNRNIIIISSNYKLSLNQNIFENLHLEELRNIGKAGMYSIDEKDTAYVID